MTPAPESEPLPGTDETAQGPPTGATLGGDPDGEAAPGAGSESRQPRQSNARREEPGAPEPGGRSLKTRIARFFGG